VPARLKFGVIRGVIWGHSVFLSYTLKDSQEYFGAHGELIDVYCKQGRGFGFVTFRDGAGNACTPPCLPSSFFARAGAGKRVFKNSGGQGDLMMDLNLFGNRTEKKDFGNSDRCKRGYRQYRTWVEAGGGEVVCRGAADRGGPFGVAGLGERRRLVPPAGHPPHHMFRRYTSDSTAPREFC